MKYTFFDLLREQLSRVPPVPRDDLSGKTVMVIGANAGIGFEAAKHFATMNPGRLILTCRDQKRGDEALERIRTETGCKTGEVWLVDLASFASVNAFGERFDKSNERLDIVVANAALSGSPSKCEVTNDGWESTFQVNNLSTNLICLLLLPHMLQTANDFNTSPRLVVVASTVHYLTTVSDKFLNSPNPVQAFGKPENITLEDFRTQQRYPDTKLFNLLFIRSLASHLPHGSPLLTSAVNPGLCISNLRKDFTGIDFIVSWLMDRFIAWTSEQGSRQLLWCAVGHPEDPNALRGAYVSAMAVREPSDFVISEAGHIFQEKLWDDMIIELSKVNPKVQQIAAQFLKQPL